MSMSVKPLQGGQIVAALDVGSSKIACLIAQVQGAPEDPQALAASRVIGIGFQRSEGVKSGMVLEPAAVEQAIRSAVDKAERQAGLSIDRLYVSMNAGRLHSENYSASLDLENSRIKRRQVERLMREGWAHVADNPRAVLHAMPLGFTLDGVSGIDSPVGYTGARLSADFHAVTADMAPVQHLLGCIEDSYLSPVSVVAAPYASALASVRREELHQGVLVLDLGGGTSSLAVLAAGRFVFAASLSKGGSQISSALAKRFGVGWREAEMLKLHMGRGGADEARYPQASRLVTRQLSGILLHLKQKLEASGFAGDVAQRVVLTGGGALYHDAVRLTAEIFGKPTRRATPRAVSGLPPQLVNPAFTALWGTLVYQEKRHLELSQTHADAYSGGAAGSIRRLGGWLHNLAEG